MLTDPPMRKYRKQFFSILSCIAIISLMCSSFPSSEVKCEEGKSEESAIRQVVQHLQDKRVTLGDEDLQVAAETICNEAQYNNVDYRLVLAVIEVESNYRHDAISRRGARGLMQLKPSTAQEVAQKTDMSYSGSSDLFEPVKNIQIGVHFLSKLIDDFKSIQKALYAYNFGPNRAKRKIAKLPINDKEPHSQYTKRVMLAFQNNMSTLPAF